MIIPKINGLLYRHVECGWVRVVIVDNTWKFGLIDWGLEKYSLTASQTFKQDFDTVITIKLPSMKEYL